MNEQTNPRYAFSVEYHHTTGHKSSVIGAASTLEKARNDLAHNVEYYSTECPVIIDLAEIVKICPACNGAGEKVKYWRKSSIITKRTPCKACNGQGNTQYEKWDVIPVVNYKRTPGVGHYKDCPVCVGECTCP